MAEFGLVWGDGALAGERVLKLSGPFTINAVFEFQAAVRQNPTPILIVDLTDVVYMDSALGSVMGLHVSCQQHGRHYALVGATDRLMTMFKVAGVASILTMYGSHEEAEAVLGSRAATA